MQVGGPLGSLGFVNLSTIDIWGWLTPCRDGLSSHCRMMQYPLASTLEIPIVPPCLALLWQPKPSSDAARHPPGDRIIHVENHWFTLVPSSHFDKPFKSPLDSENGAKTVFASLLFLGPSYLKTQVPRWKKSAPVEIIHSSIPPWICILCIKKMRSLQPGINLL